MVLVGCNDLCMEMGIPSQFDHPRLAEAMRKVADACRAHGKYAGLGGIYDEKLVTDFVAMGILFVLGGGDVPIFMAAATQRAKFLRGITPG